jgi:hypothetical protein
MVEQFDIHRSVGVRVDFVATFDTDKLRLALTVSLVDTATTGTPLRGVGGVHVDRVATSFVVQL